MTPTAAATLSVRNPRTGQIDHELPVHDAAQVAAIAQSLRQAQSAWQDRGLQPRLEAIASFAVAMAAAREELVQALTADTENLSSSLHRIHAVGTHQRVKGFDLRSSDNQHLRLLNCLKLQSALLFNQSGDLSGQNKRLFIGINWCRHFVPPGLTNRRQHFMRHPSLESASFGFATAENQRVQPRFRNCIDRQSIGGTLD